MIPKLRNLMAMFASILMMPDTATAQTADFGTDDYINPDRPGIADGSNVVGAGRVQIEAGFQVEYRHDSSGHEHRLFVPTLLRFGLDRDWELRVEGNTYSKARSFDTAGISSFNEGLAPTSIGLKYHFLDASGERRPSVGAIIRLYPPSGSGDFKTFHTTGDLRLTADWDFAPKWSLNPNVGVALYEDGGATYTTELLAATLSWNSSKVFNLFVDTGIQSREGMNAKASVIFDAGTAVILGHNTQLDFSIGTGASGITPPHPFISAGVSRRF